MFVFYKIDSGNIVFTIEGESYPAHLVSETTGVIETAEPLGDIACWQVIEGALVKVTLEPIKAAYLERIRREVSVRRSLYITDLVGQDMVYLRKEAEAVAYLAEAAPDLGNYPMLAAEVGVTAETAHQVAQIWLYMSQAWQGIAARLEGLRLVAGNAIAAALTEADILAAYDAFELSLAAGSG
jgi:hypothetical protein